MSIANGIEYKQWQWWDDGDDDNDDDNDDNDGDDAAMMRNLMTIISS